MSSTVKNLPKTLDCELDNDNSSLSVGEKQLLNLARVLLQNNKIVIFDEATGKIDGNTDQEIQRIIGEVFKECTVITIAHRLSTILDCDRVMVLDQGEIMEFDRPDVLLNKPSGLLKQLQEIA
jgi:ATP-binding cassette subfamily C (CFTR/MRP) protein 12